MCSSSHPTVFEEIAFGPLQLDMPPEEVKTRVLEVLEMIGITRLGRSIASHSERGGEEKGLHSHCSGEQPGCFFYWMSPPQDWTRETQLWPIELLQELGKAGKTIITATHDLETVEQISKRAIVMGEDHRIVVDGSVERVLDNLELLLSANLIHEHMHVHGKLVHEHLHAHEREHMHEHEDLEL